MILKTQHVWLGQEKRNGVLSVQTAKTMTVMALLTRTIHTVLLLTTIKKIRHVPTNAMTIVTGFMTWLTLIVLGIPVTTTSIRFDPRVTVCS